MTKWLNGLSIAHKILIRIFFGLLGMTLLVVVYYAGGREMLQLTDEKSDWTKMHVIFLGSGLIFITISIWLEKLPKLYDFIIQTVRRVMEKFGLKSKT